MFLLLMRINVLQTPHDTIRKRADFGPSQAYTASQRAQLIFGRLQMAHLLHPHPTQCTGP